MAPAMNPSTPLSAQHVHLFEKLKTRCAACLAEPNLENITALRQFIDDPDLTTAFLRPLTTYLVYPLRIIIENVPQIVRQAKKPTRYRIAKVYAFKIFTFLFSSLVPNNFYSIYSTVLMLFWSKLHHYLSMKYLIHFLLCCFVFSGKMTPILLEKKQQMHRNNHFHSNLYHNSRKNSILPYFVAFTLSLRLVIKKYSPLDFYFQIENSNTNLATSSLCC